MSLPDLSLSNFSKTTRTLTVDVRTESGDQHFSETVVLDPVGTGADGRSQIDVQVPRNDEDELDPDDSYLTLSLSLENGDPGEYTLRVGDDGETVETPLVVEADGVPSFLTASVLIRPDGSLTLRVAET